MSQRLVDQRKEQDRKNRVTHILQEMLAYESKRNCDDPSSPQHWVSIASCYDGDKNRASAWVIDPETKEVIKVNREDLPSAASIRFRCRNKMRKVEWIAVKLHTNSGDGKRFYWSLRAPHADYNRRFLNAYGKSLSQPFGPMETVGQK